MPEDRDLDRPDETADIPTDAEDEAVGIGEDDDDFEEDLDDEELNEEPRGMSPTHEVGSEGGSPGDAMEQRRFERGGRGSEATETWQGTSRAGDMLDRRDDDGVPVRRSPN